jgi:hypothetical protein
MLTQIVQDKMSGILPDVTTIGVAVLLVFIALWGIRQIRKSLGIESQWDIDRKRRRYQSMLLDRKIANLQRSSSPTHGKYSWEISPAEFASYSKEDKQKAWDIWEKGF